MFLKTRHQSHNISFIVITQRKTCIKDLDYNHNIIKCHLRFSNCTLFNFYHSFHGSFLSILVRCHEVNHFLWQIQNANKKLASFLYAKGVTTENSLLIFLEQMERNKKPALVWNGWKMVWIDLATNLLSLETPWQAK